MSLSKQVLLQQIIENIPHKKIELIIQNYHDQHKCHIIEMAKRCISSNAQRSKSEYKLCLENIAEHYSTLIASVNFKVEGTYKLNSVEKSLQNARKWYQNQQNRKEGFSLTLKHKHQKSQNLAKGLEAIQYFEDKKSRLWSYLLSLEAFVTKLYQKAVRLFQTTYAHVRQNLPITDEFELKIPKLTYLYSNSKNNSKLHFGYA